MKHRDDWIDEAVQRQDNIDPIRRIPNGALFQGALINGNRRLNGIQRVGALIIGLSALAAGLFMLAQIIVALHKGDILNAMLPNALFVPFSLWAGYKITIHALVNNPRKFPPNNV
jgi:hypothetical protein